MNKLLPYTTAVEWRRKFPKFNDEKTYQVLENESKRRIVVAGTGEDITKKQSKTYQTNIKYGNYLVEFNNKCII